MNLTCKMCKSQFERFGKTGPIPNFCLSCRKQRAVQALLRFAKRNAARRKNESKIYYHQNRTKESERNAKYREKNSNRLLEKNRANKKSNRARYRTYEHARRARLNASPGKFTKEEFENLCLKCNHCCLRCGLQKPLVPDHVIPLSKGGTNRISNIQPLCAKCNASKNRHHSTDYRK